ncbi:MAG TPA: hypothetical protein VFX76_05940, partial [Roseiflexaceae bacterium]|nr:hypothetical protein [Roseiflexaceae bacterium]
PLSVMSVFSMSNQWAWINNLLPIVAALSVTGAEAYQACVDFALSKPAKEWRATGLYGLVSLLMIGQFIALRYDFRSQIPTKETLEAGQEIVDIVRQAQDPVFIPTSPYLLYLAGKPTHFHMSSMGDLVLATQEGGDILEQSKPYQEQIGEYLTSQAIQTAILPFGQQYRTIFNEKHGYKCESLVEHRAPLKTVTGAINYLDQICRFQGNTAKQNTP